MLLMKANKDKINESNNCNCKNQRKWLMKKGKAIVVLGD